MTKGKLAALFTALVLSGAAIFWWAAKPPPKLLMRDFQVPDLGRVFDGAPVDTLEPYDVFVYGHTGLYEKTVGQMVDAGNPGYRYYNMLTLPLPSWVGGDNVWFNWLNATVRDWDAVLTDTLGAELVFIAFGFPSIYDWSEIGPERYSQIIDQQLAFKGACVNLFLDQFWLQPADWMMDEVLGPGLGAVDQKKLPLWETNITNYLMALRKTVAARGGLVLVNGDRGAPQPMFIENAQWVHMWPWQSSVDLWRKHRQNVLSVDSGGYEDSLLVAWLKYGGTISLTGESWATDQSFYLRADKSRKAGMLVKVMP